LINQLRQALAEYYPTALQAFEDWGTPASWSFLQHFPTPQALQQAGKRRWETFLHASRLWRGESGPRRLALFSQLTPENAFFRGSVRPERAVARGFGLSKRL
jgi:hypothetical protein